jgi:hypothetical protein
MKLRKFQIYMVALFLVFSISGIGFADAWDFSDYHDTSVVHIDRADGGDLDMDNVKHPPLTFEAITVAPSVLPQPEVFVLFHCPVTVQLTQPQLHIADSFPSRASPA